MTSEATRDRRSGRARPRGLRTALAAAAVVAVALVGSVAAPAYADDYPSWQDVQNAKANESAKSAQVSRINGLISELKGEVASTQAEAEKRGAELQEAEARLDAATVRAQQLEDQAAASQKKADDASVQAGKLAAQLYRTGGRNLTANLFLSGNGASTSSPDKLLSDLGSMSKLVEQSNKVYADAKAAQNTASSLADQADVAKQEREKLRVAADNALKAAIAAAKAAQDKLAEQQKQIVIMQAQLAALKDATSKTVAGYEAGVAAAAAAAAARGSGGLPGGYVGPQGWAVPAAGPITDGFGARPSPGGVGSTYHMGIDIGAGCNSPIYAAFGGTVEYAGPLGTYGNFVLIDNGNGVETGYAHIRDGGILVGIGQGVSAGQPIARVGTTGASTGCHLHYEVRVGGQKIDGIPFMRDRQAPLG
ncbi:peptidoglycan DD-metalloendopeptidase family protein [Leifsonia sp. F6_8S_P_1B]|uniref:Peptidoglycan DD-metalloendopeptidase family protein n=1 Tax=Leifsonia williamsii TaxID=3035919 RepID=A0ABT8KFZ1_9MICO|nr:M23 family metallopeptidase [Leifsonia williamsii]MDN4616384.1 peptidoglycan DD-metalloendopeptidase family protein [Leifsonia williamsii]